MIGVGGGDRNDEDAKKYVASCDLLQGSLQTTVLSIHHAYWKGLKAGRSTGHSDFDKAVQAVHDMLGNGGRRSTIDDTLMSDEEFDQIQRQHYGRKQDPAAQKRAEKSLLNCMEAVTAFRKITGLAPITIATPDDCARFQIEALKKPKDWRVNYSTNARSKKRKQAKTIERLSPNTVVKWSVALRAAFNRVNRNAGKKCVRGVVAVEKLLTENPWNQFLWIEGREAEIRQFKPEELLAILDYFEENFPSVTVATLFAKTCLWSYARRREVARLRWDELRLVGEEVHFDIVGKWAVRKWFRIPAGLYHEMLEIKSGGPFVFEQYYPGMIEAHNSTAEAY